MHAGNLIEGNKLAFKCNKDMKNNYNCWNGCFITSIIIIVAVVVAAAGISEFYTIFLICAYFGPHLLPRL